MKENNLKIIALITNILKIIVILSIIVIIAIIAVVGIRNIIKEKQSEDIQVVGEINYTDDVKEISELEKMGNKFGVKLYNGFSEENRFLLVACAITLFIVELIFLSLALECINNLLLNNDNNQLKALKFISISKVCLVAIVNLFTYLVFKGIELSPVTVVEIIVTIILTIICYVKLK